jgi:hypothetical protein
MKYLNFSIAETSGRTFEVPMDKIKRLVEQERAIAKAHGVTFDINLEDDYDLAHFLVDYCLDEISADEKANDYLGIQLSSSKFTGED